MAHVSGVAEGDLHASSTCRLILMDRAFSHGFMYDVGTTGRGSSAPGDSLGLACAFERRVPDTRCTVPRLSQQLLQPQRVVLGLALLAVGLAGCANEPDTTVQAVNLAAQALRPAHSTIDGSERTSGALLEPYFERLHCPRVLTRRNGCASKTDGHR